ncbi:MAG: HAD family hydrolase, partial [Nitrosarchaeum sp.]
NSLNNLSLEPSKVLVVGDRIHDVESARKAGCTPILKINQIKKIPSFDCKLIENLNELKEII